MAEHDDDWFEIELNDDEELGRSLFDDAPHPTADLPRPGTAPSAPRPSAPSPPPSPRPSAPPPPPPPPPPPRPSTPPPSPRPSAPPPPPRPSTPPPPAIDGWDEGIEIDLDDAEVDAVIGPIDLGTPPADTPAPAPESATGRRWGVSLRRAGASERIEIEDVEDDRVAPLRPAASSSWLSTMIQRVRTGQLEGEDAADVAAPAATPAASPPGVPLVGRLQSRIRREAQDGADELDAASRPERAMIGALQLDARMRVRDRLRRSRGGPEVVADVEPIGDDELARMLEPLGAQELQSLQRRGFQEDAPFLRLERAHYRIAREFTIAAVTAMALFVALLVLPASNGGLLVMQYLDDIQGNVPGWLTDIVGDTDKAKIAAYPIFMLGPLLMIPLMRDTIAYALRSLRLRSIAYGALAALAAVAATAGLLSFFNYDPMWGYAFFAMLVVIRAAAGTLGMHIGRRVAR